MASNCRKVAASEPGHLHDAATCEDHLENRSVARVGHLNLRSEAEFASALRADTPPQAGLGSLRGDVVRR
jgi:hypothetical protein